MSNRKNLTRTLVITFIATLPFSISGSAHEGGNPGGSGGDGWAEQAAIRKAKEAAARAANQLQAFEAAKRAVDANIGALSSALEQLSQAQLAEAKSEVLLDLKSRQMENLKKIHNLPEAILSTPEVQAIREEIRRDLVLRLKGGSL